MIASTRQKNQSPRLDSLMTQDLSRKIWSAYARYGEADQHGFTCSSRPPARIERCIASSARTTAIPSPALVNGCFPVTMHSRKSAHWITRGSPSDTCGIVTSPFRMLARNEANESTYVGGVDTSLTCLS